MIKTLCIANAVALSSVILVNYISVTSLIGNTVKDTSDKYFNYFTPDSYAFSIWTLIYFGLVFFVIYSFIKKHNNDFVLKIGWWFAFSCFANIMWILVWLSDFIGFSVIIMMLLLFSLYKIITILKINIFKFTKEQIRYVHLPFSIYIGWVTIALLANISAFLTKINWINDGISGVNYTIAMLCLAGLINVLVILKRNMYSFGFVGIWALAAIAKTNWHQNQVLFLTAILVCSIIFITMILHLFLQRKKQLVISTTP